MELNQIVLLATNIEEKSLGERMANAGLNTIMGITIVFLVLYLICLLISLLKYVNKFDAKKSKKQDNAPMSSVPASNQYLESIEENLTDDLELVAVITAAIHAYEEAQGNPVPANGLYVRSIRKVNRSKWLNA